MIKKMSTLKTNNIEPVSGNGITINSSLNVTGGITASLTTPDVLTFDPISTPSITTGGMFYSSSGNFYIESSSTWAPVLTAIPRIPNSSSYDDIVRAAYPQAVDSYHFGEVIKSFISGTFGYVSDNIVLANSICSDDVDGPVFINEVNIGQFPSSTNQFLGPFMAGGLAGYPHTGRLAVAAWASHATTETSGALLLINMPHIGITQQEDLVTANDNVGRMHRKGKVDATSDLTCGAAYYAYAQASQNILGLSVPPTASEYPDNYQWFTLTNILYPFSESFSGSYSENMMLSTELIRSASDAWVVGPNGIENPLSFVPANLDIYYCNGIFINTDYGYNSYVTINSFQHFLSGSGWTDHTAAFTSSLLT
jgi:hypothetical protein